MPSKTPLFWAGLLLLGAGCSATRNSSGEESPGQRGSPPAGAPAAPAPSSEHAALTPECQKLHAEIVALDKGIPEWFVNVKRSTQEIEADMLRAIDLSRRFLAECGGSPPRCEVKSILARILMARNGKYATDLRTESEKRLAAEGRDKDERSRDAALAEEKRAIAAYFQEIDGLARSVASDCPAPVRARHVALRILFDLAERDYRWEDMRAFARQLLAEKPEFDYVTHVHFETAWSYMAESRYREAVQYLREVLATHSGDAEYVLYVNQLLPSLIGAGELQAAEDLMLSVREEYPGRMAALRDGSMQSPYGDWYYNLYEQWYYNAPFWLGHVRFARGDVDGARRALEENIAEVDGLEAKLAAEGKKIGSIGGGIIGITRDFRSKDLLRFIKDFHGKSPGVDLDLKDMWATENRLDPAALAGKVVVVVFRMPRNRKAQTFLQEVDAIVKERAQDGLAGVVVGSLLGSPTPERRAQARENMRKDMVDLGVSLPAGFEAPAPASEGGEPPGPRISHAFHARVGQTATVVILDRRSRMSWYILDPQDADRATVRQVIARLLAEKP
jgi:tetratricopeptide (TPR) repeat protein